MTSIQTNRMLDLFSGKILSILGSICVHVSETFSGKSSESCKGWDFESLGYDLNQIFEAVCAVFSTISLTCAPVHFNPVKFRMKLWDIINSESLLSIVSCSHIYCTDKSG